MQRNKNLAYRKGKKKPIMNKQLYANAESHIGAHTIHRNIVLPLHKIL